jgi:diguanylate cyclase (GGDEF)-like protein/PAS domain S-box-containing protein
MPPNIQFPPVFYLYFFTAILAAVIAAIAWTRRPAAGAGAITVVLIGCSIWALGDALEHLFIEFEIKQWIDLTSYFGIVLVPAGWLVFAAQYSGWGSIFTRRRMALLWIEPVLVLIAAFTDPLHHWFYTFKSLTFENGFYHLILQEGPLFWVHTVYSYTLIILAYLLLIRTMLQAPQIYRRQSILLLIGGLVPGVSNLLYIAHIPPFAYLDVTPLSFMITGILVVFGVYRYRLLDLTPHGRDVLIEKMEDIVVVIDHFGRVVDINQAATSFLNIDRDQMIGHVLNEFLTPWPELIARFQEVKEAHTPIIMQRPEGVRYFDLRLNPIYTQDNTYMGRLIILRDITEIQTVQQALAESESRYRSLIDTSPDPILQISVNGEIEFYNRATVALLDLPNSSELIGRTAEEYIDESSRDETTQRTRQIRENGRQQNFEILIHAYNGHLIPVEISISLLKDAQEQPISYVCVLRDISERRHAENEIRRSAQAEHEQREISETLREIGVILNTTLDVETLLDHLLTQAARVIPYDSGNISFIRGRKVSIVRSYGYDKFNISFTDAENRFVFDIEETRNFAEMISSREPFIIPDTSQYTGWVGLEETSYIHSWLGAPIVARDAVIGFFSLDKIEKDFYKPAHAQILAYFAAQAGMALQNAWLFDETNQNLKRTIQLNQILQKIGGSLDLNALLNEVLQMSCTMLNASAGMLALYNSNLDVLEPINKVQPANGQMQWKPRINSGVSWDVYRSGEPLLMTDLNDYSPYLALITADEVASILVVPVRTAEKIIGVLCFYKLGDQDPFTPRDVPIAVTLGSEAGDAIRTVRLFEDVRRRADESENLRKASSAVTSALNLDVVLDQIISNLDKVVPFDSCSIFLNQGDELVIVANRGFKNARKLVGATFSRNNTLVRETYASRHALILTDAQTDPRFEKWGEAEQIHGWMGIPLFARGTVIGYLTVDSHQINAYSNEDAELAQAFANQAAIAIENAQLYERTQYLAITDPLTELNNRRHFFDLAKREFYRSRRYGKLLSMMMIDVDDLKLVNDSYGHQVGDLLIAFIGGQINAQLRLSDISGRYAGDEFVVLLPDSDLEAAIRVAERLVSGITAGIQLPDGQNIPASASMGISTLQDDCFSLEVLLNRADQALYAAKQNSKSSIFVWCEGKLLSSSELPAPAEN